MHIKRHLVERKTGGQIEHFGQKLLTFRLILHLFKQPNVGICGFEQTAVTLSAK